MIGADASSKTVCPRPDVIVINTGLHDHSGHHNISEFKWRLKAVLGRLQTVYRKSHGHHANIIWKSMFLYHQNPIVNELRPYNDVALALTRSVNISFVNISDAISYVPQFSSNRKKYTHDGLHFRQQPLYGVVGTVSTMITQQMLNAICRS